MKFKITITKEVIDKSLMCGVENKCIVDSCALAVALNELIPNVTVNKQYINFHKKSRCRDYAWVTGAATGQEEFIKLFDSMTMNPQQRYTLVGQSFDVEIPDEVIEYWYGDASKAAQKIIDNPIMQVVC